VMNLDCHLSGFWLNRKGVDESDVCKCRMSRMMSAHTRGDTVFL